VAAVLATCRHFLGASIPIARLETFLAEAYTYAAEEYAEEDAVAWANGYAIPATAVDADTAALADHSHNFDALVAARLLALAPSRLNHARVDALHPENPERNRMRALVDGMPIPLPDGLVPNGSSDRPRLRNKYVKLASAVNKMFMAVRTLGLAFVFPVAVARLIPGLHLSLAHWTTKKLKRQGRPLLDASDESAGSLKAKDATAAVRDMWGAITHPTISDIVLCLLAFVDREHAARGGTGPKDAVYDDVVVFKCDLKGAFNLVSIRPGHAQRLALELTGGLVIVFICGMFGWTGTPFVFEAVTRALRYELALALFGLAMMYVDDIMAFTLRRELDADLEAAKAVCRGLLGPDAVEDTKTHTTDDNDARTIDLIGYELNLRLRTLSISHFNFLRAVYGFFAVDIDRPVPVPTMEKLASWSSRYVAICPWLQPFNQALYAAYAGRNRIISVELDEGARLSIRMWRAGLCVLRFDPARFARPLDTFRRQQPRHVLECDASLFGTGSLLYARDVDGSERLLGGSAASLADLNFEDDTREQKSSNQNTAEYIGAILSVLTARRLGLTDLAVRLRGDSVAALTWVDTGKVHSSRASNAFLFFTLMVLQLGLVVTDVEHLPGAKNWKCDKLSRAPRTCTMDDIGHPGLPLVRLVDDPTAAVILELCDPRLDTQSEAGFSSFWDRAHVVLSTL